MRREPAYVRATNLEKRMYSRERLAHAAEWYGWQSEELNSRLRNAFDALRLYDYAQAHPSLPEMADEWEAADLIAALGYNPADKQYSEPDTSGCAEVARLLERVRELLDSVVFVKTEGDTVRLVRDIDALLGA